MNLSEIQRRAGKILGENIQRARKRKKLTQEEFSKQIGITRVHLSRIERNIMNPSMHVLKQIAQRLNTTVSDLTKE